MSLRHKLTRPIGIFPIDFTLSPAISSYGKEATVPYDAALLTDGQRNIIERIRILCPALRDGIIHQDTVTIFTPRNGAIARHIYRHMPYCAVLNGKLMEDVSLQIFDKDTGASVILCFRKSETPRNETIHRTGG